MDFALGGKLHRVSAATRLRELFETADKIPEIIFLRHWLGVCLVGNQNGKTTERTLFARRIVREFGDIGENKSIVQQWRKIKRIVLARFQRKRS